MMIIKESKRDICLKNIRMSSHLLSQERSFRYYELGNLSSQKIVKIFWVDKGHRNGPELHILTYTGLIVIVNAKTLVLCTVLYARPGQIKRYYNAVNQTAPNFLLNRAYKNIISHKNQI